MRLVEDESLRAGFRRGDRDALSAVYREYVRSVYGFLAKGFAFESAEKRVQFTGLTDPALLEDTVQEVFVRAFAEPARLRYDGLRPYRNYLLTIARNLVADEYRRRLRMFVSLGDDAQEETWGDAPPTPESEAADSQLGELARKFLDDLQGEELELFEQRFRQGLSVEAVARAMGRSEHWVKRTARQLRKRFYRLMKQHGYLEGYSWNRSELARVAPVLLCLVGGLR